MGEKECIICGKTFNPKVATQKCCSPQCSRINGRNLSRKRANENKEKVKQRQEEEKQIKQNRKMNKKAEWKRVAAIMAEYPTLSYGQLVAKGVL